MGALLFRPGAEAMLLRRFGVVPSAQGKGVAQRLVQGAVDATLGYPALAVLAREELPATVGFWARRGFEVTERRPPYVELRRPLPTSLGGRGRRRRCGRSGERLGRSRARRRRGGAHR